MSTTTPDSAGNDTFEAHRTAQVNYWRQRIKQIATQYPDIESAAFDAARTLLAQLGSGANDPYQVYWHWFDSANSSPRTFTGWEHYGSPRQSMTLVELVMRRFDLDQQRNSDLLAQMGGFYTADENAHVYNEHNEVRLDPREVLTYFWRIDFASQYLSRVRGFWINNQTTYRFVSKIGLLCSAVLQCQRGDMTPEDFMDVYDAVANDPSGPFSPEKLYGDIVSGSTTVLRPLDIGGMVCQSVIRFCTRQGREILYCAMQHPAFVTVAGKQQLYEWLQAQLQTPAARRVFGVQFVKPEHNQGAEWRTLQGHLADIAQSPWKNSETPINTQERLLDGYGFDFLTANLKTDMELDAKYLLTSNARLDKGLWLGYLDSFLKLYGGFSLIGWPIAAVSIAAGLIDIGLYTDKAINALSDQERTQAIRGAVLQAFNVMLTLPLLGDASSLGDYAQLEVESTDDLDAEAELPPPSGEASEDDTPTSSDDDSDTSSSVASTSGQGDTPAALSRRSAHDLAAWRPALLRANDFTLHRTGRFAGLCVRAGLETFAPIDNALYRVRFVSQIKQWAVVDPFNPYALNSYIPISLDAKGVWQPAQRVTASIDTPLQQPWDWSGAPLDGDIGLQPPAAPITVDVPLDGVEKVMDRYMVRTVERGPLLAMYDAGEKTWRANHLGNTAYLWRTPEGAWHSGERGQWLEAVAHAPAPHDVKIVTLPPLPAPVTQATPIPKLLHYLWLGHEMPSQALLDNLLVNAARMKGYRVIIHTDMDTPRLLHQLTRQFAGKDEFEVRALAEQDFFKTLCAGPSGPQYRALRTGPAKNYAAASDLLRYPLLDTYGGIYTDVDNTFKAATHDIDLPAGPNDLLLDDAVTHADVPYSGYNSHVLGSHPGNPVLKAVSRSIQRRFKARPQFYAQPRPTLSKTASAVETKIFWAYIKDTFEMTGPQVLDDVLRETRPDYYDLALRADLRRSLGISSEEYELRLLARVEHYFPFANRAEIVVGNLHSWKSTR